jgi:nitroreductase
MHVVRRDVDGQADAVVAELLDGGQRLHERPLEQTATVLGVDVETAIRTRRTHKQYGPEPVPEDVLHSLLDLARFAPNHHMTQPWRFRVLGPSTRHALDAVVPEKEVAKLRRAPTLVLATAVLTGDPHQDEEDLHATACAVYAVLLGATARRLASYWRTPQCFSEPAVRELLGVGEDERVVALIHLGPAVSEPPEKERAPLDEVVGWLE